MAKKRKKKETESLLIATENNAIRTNYIKVKIIIIIIIIICYKIASVCYMVTINHIIKKCSELAQKIGMTG